MNLPLEHFQAVINMCHSKPSTISPLYDRSPQTCVCEFKYELEKKSDKGKFKFASQHAQPTPKMSFLVSATILQDRSWKVEFSSFGAMLVELRHCQGVSIVFCCETLWSFWTPSNAAHVPRWSLVRPSLIFAGWPPHTHTHLQCRVLCLKDQLSLCMYEKAFVSVTSAWSFIHCVTEKSGQEVMSKGSRGMEVILSSLEVSSHPQSTRLLLLLLSLSFCLFFHLLRPESKHVVWEKKDSDVCSFMLIMF